jgi:hypothetical protein
MHEGRQEQTTTEHEQSVSEVAGVRWPFIGPVRVSSVSDI